jgi:hypothetical protein
MNYILIHAKFIEYFKTSTPLQRILQRNQNDARLLEDYPYTERHHITPRSLGGLDVDDNLVELLPEEHIFIHELRYKAFNRREDMLAVRFCLNGFNNTHPTKPLQPSIVLTKSIRKAYSFIKTNSANFRKLHGWQTPEGKQRISKSRLGQIPVIDAITGISAGCVEKTNPDYISGKLVHHSKGLLSVKHIETNKTVRISATEYQNNKNAYENLINQKGENNGRYSGISDEQILEYAIQLSTKIGSIAPYVTLSKYFRSKDIMLPRHLSNMRFNGKGMVNGYVAALQAKLPDLKYKKQLTDKQKKELYD